MRGEGFMPRARALVFLGLSLLGCGDGESKPASDLPDTWAGVCVDADKDGFGFQCERGSDCDDTDPKLNKDCGCLKPATGCACEEGTPPQDCVIDREVQPTGSLLCKTGQRYCRDAAWTDCIGVRSFEIPAPREGVGQAIQGLIDQDAAPVICDVCDPLCYKVTDPLQTIYGDGGIAAGPQGGLTLAAQQGTITQSNPDELDPTPPCTPGVIIPAFNQYDNDCDGIPDNYDDVVGAPGKTPPFVTSHEAITMDLAPGQTGSNTFELNFGLKAVDVYFLLDTTASMDGELKQLITDLTSGTFLDDPSTPGNEANSITCATALGAASADQTLKSKGIAGNIACLVPNSGFGTGFFREIPFDNPDPNGLSHAYDWFIPYEHRQDISTTVDDTLNALKLYYTAGNVSWPEDDIFALYAVATGNQVYTGWDRPGIEAKTCPSSSKYFGYPCFRRDALPVVVLITDASLMNGPDVDVYNNANLSSCITTASPFTVTTTACSSDYACEVKYPGQGYFCNYAMGSGGVLSGKCAVQKTLTSACQPDGLPDGKNDDSTKQPLNYEAVQTNTMNVAPDATYHRVDGNEDFSTAYDVGAIDNAFATYVGDTRGMAADINANNLGVTCSQWPTTGNAASTSPTTPGYPDAVFKFTVNDPSKTLTISTAGSNHAPTLAIISAGGAGSSTGATTQLNAPSSSDTTPWSFSANEVSGAFDYSVAVNLGNGFTGSWRRSSFGACMDGSPNATDLAPDAVFAFTPSADMNDVSFSTGGSQAVASADSTANAWPGVDLGNELGQALTYNGNTAAATNKWTSAQLGTASCRANTTAANHEHVFKFTLTATTNIELRVAAPSTYDPSISLFDGSSTSTALVPLTCSHTASGDDVITGSYAAGTYYVMVHAYNTTSATGTYTLTLKELTDEAIVLYDNAPSEPTQIAIAGPNGANSNDTFYTFDVGQIDGQFLMLNAGDTTAPNIHADYLPSSFQQATGTCSDVSGMSNDAVVEFSVDTTRDVRIETFDGTGATADQSAGFDHVVAVVERPTQLAVTPTAVTNNDKTASARVVAASSVPTAIGGYSQFSGATYANSNTVTMTQSVSPQVMYDVANANTATCSTVTSDLQDVVYRFDVDAANAGIYDFDTFGSQSTTYLSLHSAAPDTYVTVNPRVATRTTPTTNNTNADSSPSGSQTGVSLGTIDGKTVTYSDTTTTSTSNKWTDAQFAGCRVTSDNAAHEHVLTFTVGSTKTVSITLTQTSPFDASLALFSTAPVAGSAQPNTSGAGFKGCSRVAGGVNSNAAGLTTVSNGVISASLAAGTYYLLVYGYQSSNSSGTYSVSVADTTTRQTRTVATDDTTADGASTALGVDLGSVDGSITTYTGTTTSSTGNKWTAAQAGTGNNASNGCRISSSDNVVHEHVLHFTVSGSSNRALKLELTRGATTFDPVLAVYSGSSGPLAVNSNLSGSILGCQRAYTASSATYTGSPALTATGNATSGGKITGTFAPGTYYLTVSGATASANSYGSYTLVITDTTSNAATIVAKSGGNFANTYLNSGGSATSATSGDTPYVDFGTLTGTGGKYTGNISSTTTDKWTGPQLGSAGNCQSLTTSTRKRAEHVFKVIVPAYGSAAASLSSGFSGLSEGVVAYFAQSAVPQIGTNLGSPTGCSSTIFGSGASVTLNNSSNTSAQTYWVMVYPRSAPTSGSYTGSYTITLNLTSNYATVSQKWSNNSQDSALDASIAGDAPYLDFGALTSSTTSSYTGTTGTSTPTKWSSAQLGSASGRTSGQAIDAVPEHLFRFTTSSAQNLSISLSGTSGQQVVLSVFQSASVPQTHSTLSPASVQTSNNASSAASVYGSYDGTYYVLVHGSKDGQYGNYTLTIGPQSSGGTFSFTGLDNSGTVATYGNFGTVNALAEYSGTLSSSSQKRWTENNVATYTAPYADSNGCRSYSFYGSTTAASYEHAFKFTLTSATALNVLLTAGSSLNAVVSVYGPITTSSWTWGTNVPRAYNTGDSPATTFNNSNLLTGSYPFVSMCDAVSRNTTGGILGQTFNPGDYLVIVHSASDWIRQAGSYTLDLVPQQSGGNFSNSALNPGSTLTTTALSSFNDAYLNTAHTPTNYANSGDFGTMDATHAYTYSGNLSSSTQKRWTHTQVAVTTSQSSSYTAANGCRTSSSGNNDSNYEQVFKFRLTGSMSTKVNLVTDSSLDASLNVYGPFTSWSDPTPSTTFNSITTPSPSVSICDNAGTSGNVSISGTWGAGYYIVLVHARRKGSNDTGGYTLTIGAASAPTVYAAPFADFGTVTGTTKYFSGTLSSSTAKKWTASEVGFGSTTFGCRTNTSSNSYEHAFRFSLASTGTVMATLNTNNGGTAFNGVLSIFGPISGWSGGTTTVNAGTTLTSYGSSVATCVNANSSSNSITGTYGAGDYLLLVHGRDTGNAGDYTVSISSTSTPYAANGYDAALNGTTRAPVVDLGDVTSGGYSYQGSTAGGTSKFSNLELGTNTAASCRSTSATTAIDAVKEHVFKFELTQSRSVKITLNNPNWTGVGAKDWDSVVSLFGPNSSDPSVGLTFSNPITCKQLSTGDNVITQSLSTAGTYYVVVHGDTNSDSGAYTLTVDPDLGTSAPTATWASGSQDGALDGGANLPPFADFGTITTTGYSYAGDTTSAISKWIGADLASTTAANGSTNGAYGCRYADTSSTGEHVFKFTLSSPQYVSVSVNPSGFDPVLSVFGPLSSTPDAGDAIGTTTVSSCYHDSTHTGTATNGTASLSGTWGAGSYYVIVHGYADSTDISSPKSGGTYTLTLDPTVPTTLTNRTVTTDNTSAEATTASATVAIDLGTVDNYVSTYAGTTSSSTSNKWTDAQIASASTSGSGAAAGCRSGATQNNGREHLLKFTVSKATGLPLKVALTGALDGSLSIFSGSAPTAGNTVTTLLACSHRTGTAADAVSATFTGYGGAASAGVVSATFPAGTYYVIVHGYATDNVGAYTLTLTDNSTNYTSSTVGASSAVASGSGPQTGVDLGTVDGKLISYSGDSTNASSKWTQAQVSSPGNTGCRAAGNDTASEHLLKFTVASQRQVAIRLVVPSGSNLQPVLSVFSTGGVAVGSAISGLTGCSRVSSSAVTDNVAATGYTASAGLITGTFAAGTYYLLVHGYQSSNSQGAYNLYVFDADPESMGEADVGHLVNIDGDTSTITFNQWAGADFPSVNSVNYGGRLDATQRTGERIYQFTVTGSTKNLTVSLTGSFDSVLSVFDTLPTAIPAGGASLTGLLESNRNSGSFLRSITRSFAPGTYYVMVHGYRASANPVGTFTLSVGDNTWQSGLIACNSRGASSKLTAVNLTAGTYYLVVKSGAGTGMAEANYRYVLNIRRTYAQPFIACDHEGYGAGSRRGYIETTLQGGKTYAVVVRGVTPSDAGTYGVIIHDMTSGNVPLGCANAAGYTTASNNPNSFTADLQAGRTYYVVVRSNSSSSVGQADVRISHSSSGTCAFNNVTFDSVGRSSGISPYVPAKIVTKLPAGDYYAVVKGNQNLTQDSVKIPTGSTAGIPDDRGRGRYQITFGDATLAQSNQQFTPPTWGTQHSGGAYSELAARGVRVITVNSISQHGSSDLYMREQSRQISLLTGATGVNGAAIRRNIGSDGSGMGYAIVDAVADFANAVQMDMSVRLSLSPDDPGTVPPYNRRFTFLARAVPAPAGQSNGCAAPIDTNHDGVLDTHPSCGPGATPRFEIQVTNPDPGQPGDLGTCIGGATPGVSCSASTDCGTGSCSPPYPKNVPLNPNDPGGGYLMTVQLVGQDRLSTASSPQVVDEIPLYVIPQDVFPNPPTATYPAQASYDQTVNSLGCGPLETPTWNRLVWDDTLPPGTKVQWSVCATQTEAELPQCDQNNLWEQVVTVQPHGPCTTSADCTRAWCNNPTGATGTGTCEAAVGGTCASDADCGTNALCLAHACNYLSDPKHTGIDLKAAVTLFNNRNFMRVRANLFSDSARTSAPTINSYRVDYTCTQNE